MNLNIFIITSTSFFSFPFILFRLSILLMLDARDLWDQNSEGQNFNLIPTIRGSLSKESSSLSSFPVNPVHSLLWWDRVNTNNIAEVSSLLTLTYMRKASRFFSLPSPFSIPYSLFSVFYSASVLCSCPILLVLLLWVFYPSIICFLLCILIWEKTCIH